MKKAGIFLGVIFIVVAILLCVFGLRIIDKEPVETPNSEVVEQTPPVETPVVDTPVVETPPVVDTPIVDTPIVETPPVESTTVVEKVITKEISSVMTLDESQLGEPIASKEAIARIVNKRIMMVDEHTDSTAPKMLTYCFDVMTPDNMQLTLFVTNSVYTVYNLGDMLQVNYNIYTNDKGIQFPLVLNVLAVQ